MLKQGGNAWFISDRSGFKYRLKDSIKEPGTGYLIHKSESDGIYNAVDHPQANLQKYSKPYGDPFPLQDTRPDQDWTVDWFLTDEDGNNITDVYGNPIEAGQQ